MIEIKPLICMLSLVTSYNCLGDSQFSFSLLGSRLTGSIRSDIPPCRVSHYIINTNPETQMLIWNGLGFLVAVVTFGSCLLFNFVLDARFGEGYYSSHRWAIGTALIVGGLVSSVIGFMLKGRSDRYAIDEETGERFVINNSDHSFFFIPMHWAGIVIVMIGVGLAASDIFK